MPRIILHRATILLVLVAVLGGPSASYAFGYDARGRLTELLGSEVRPWEMDAGNVLVSTDKAEYEHDRRHRRTAKIELEKRADGSRAERRTEYDWDCRDRLREVRLPDGQSVRFRYDAFGRRVSKDVLPPGRGHFAKSLVMALEKGVEALPKIQRIEFLWDGDVLAADIGAVASVRAQSGGGGGEVARRSTEDAPDIDSSGAHISLGAKIARELERQRLGLAQPGDDGADPWAAAGRHVRVFVHEPGTFRPMLQLEGQRRELFVYVCDHLGMPKELVDTKGRLAWAATHSAWGRVLETWREAGTRLGVESPFRLLGQYEDAETGLCYTRYRYFDAETGRWCSPDPLGIAGGRNLLGYDGAPSFEVDPWGLCKDPAGEAPPGGVPDEHVVVRGGQSPLPEPGTVFSGAHGKTVEEAAQGVPHGTIRETTAGAIRQGGGTVESAPEPTRSGNINEKHVNITEGPGPTSFGDCKPNPVPKKDRVQ